MSEEPVKESKTLKLYRVTCTGMHGGSVGHAHGIAYVVSWDSHQAYLMMREDLERRDLGYSADRELLKVELLAETVDYPDCGTKLYFPANPAYRVKWCSCPRGTRWTALHYVLPVPSAVAVLGRSVGRLTVRLVSVCTG